MLLQAVSDFQRGEHYHLDSNDECFFFGEWGSSDHDWTPTKSLISNLKKRVGDGGYQYKSVAIKKAADLLEKSINLKSFAEITLIPIPPSKAPNSPDYDDRVWNILEALKDSLADKTLVDIRKLVYQIESYQASHTTTNRVRLDHLTSIYRVDEMLLNPAPSRIVIVDDFLTTGCHFKAMKKILLDKFPEAKVQGIFMARRKLGSGFK